jgi:hypothetical protein
MGGLWWWTVYDGRNQAASSPQFFKTRAQCWNALRRILNVKKLEIETIGGK